MLLHSAVLVWLDLQKKPIKIKRVKKAYRSVQTFKLAVGRGCGLSIIKKYHTDSKAAFPAERRFKKLVLSSRRKT
jgi:hypothetical protein